MRGAPGFGDSGGFGEEREKGKRGSSIITDISLFF